MFMASIFLFILLAVAQSFATSVVQLAVIRFLLGIPLGADVTTGYTYIMEYLPKGRREVMGNRWQVMFAAGQVVCAIVVALFLVADISHEMIWRVVLGLPLGLGKANHVVNALYARASADRSIDLTFFSALTLEKPKPDSLLEQRFIAPVIDRLFGGYPDLAYAEPLRRGELPPNIRVIEFFFLAGRWLHVPAAQQN